jgi:protein-tyrosine-phosphatase
MLHSDYPDYREKILVLSERDISDPFGGSDKVYAKSAEEINAAVQTLIDELTQGGGNIQ